MVCSMRDPANEVAEFERLQTPALLVDLDAVRHNVDHMIRLVRGDMRRWRPHTKTSKIGEVLDVLLERGVVRFKCATTREASVLLERACAPIDLLIAISHHGANLARCAALAHQHSRHRVSLLTEDPRHAKAAREAGLTLFVDVNPGMQRTGIPFADRERLQATVSAAGRSLVGVHFYEGHLRQQSHTEREALARPLYERLVALLSGLVLERPLAELEIDTSGTPAFPCALDVEALRGRDHSISPGTVVYFDTTSRDFGLQGFRQAVFVLSRVISHPDPDLVTCDAGSKSLDAAAGDPCAEIDGMPDLLALHPSEEHLPLRVLRGRKPELGALLRLVPRHVCPTVNLADQAVLLTSGKIRAIVPVGARGHEL